jgi:ribosomal-protein-serine acetyltransferase
MLIGEDGDLRVILVQDRDAAAMDAIVQMNRGLRWFEPLGPSLEVIRRARTDFADQKGFVAGIWLGGELTGQVALMDLHPWNRRATLGYYLGAAYQGRGLMTRACRLAIRYAFDEWEVHRIEAPIATANRRSRAVVERLGFTQEGILRKACRVIPGVHALEDFSDAEVARCGDRYHYDLVMYSLLRTDQAGSS